MTISHQMAHDVIQVEGLSKSYGNVDAVVNLSFSVRKGEIFGFLGPNGAGKTTTLTILEGLRRGDQGRITLLGLDVAEHTRVIKQQIGVQLQSTSLIPVITWRKPKRCATGWALSIGGTW